MSRPKPDPQCVPIPLDAHTGTIDTSHAGFFNLVATAADAAGNAGTASASLNIVDPNVVNGPAIAITSPGDGDTITAPTDIIGTVQDPALTSYKFTCAPPMPRTRPSRRSLRDYQRHEWQARHHRPDLAPE